VLRSILSIPKEETDMARYDEMTPSRTFSTPYAADERVSAFLRSVYGWMAVGLLITAAIAYLVAGSPELVVTIARNRALFWGLMLAQIGIVVWLSARVQKMSPGLASTLFIAYSALTGVTLSFVLLAFTGQSVATTFLVTAGTFGSLATYGTVTRRSLAGWGQFLFMGLIGVVLASVVGIFWQNDAFQFVLSFIGVIVFTGLTAYDAQRLKEMALALPDGRVGSYAIVGALALYLDFINLFMFLLRFTGSRRD
jgi:FtsH-binding integral membrane protein